MDGEAGWWTTSGNIGFPPLARVMGVGRQQQGGHALQSPPKLGTLNADTYIKTAALTLCYSVGEYAVLVWARSEHAHFLPQTKPSLLINYWIHTANLKNLYLLAEILKETYMHIDPNS